MSDIGHVQKEPAAGRPGFDEALAGKRAECDGGALMAGSRVPGREEFAGVLTGEYVDHGDPPWRWYRMTALTGKPPGYQWDSVWCESGSVWVMDDRS